MMVKLARNLIVLPKVPKTREVEVVYDEAANLKISTSGKDKNDKDYDTNSLLEQWRDSYPDIDDYGLYDDDMIEVSVSSKQVYEPVYKKNGESTSGTKKNAERPEATTSKSVKSSKDNEVNESNVASTSALWHLNFPKINKGSTSGTGVENSSLYKRWKENYEKDPYDDADFNALGRTKEQLDFANAFDINLHDLTSSFNLQIMVYEPVYKKNGESTSGTKKNAERPEATTSKSVKSIKDNKVNESNVESTLALWHQNFPKINKGSTIGTGVENSSLYKRWKENYEKDPYDDADFNALGRTKEQLDFANAFDINLHGMSL
ncbi:hypothetical protein Tco_1533966 [Tanacetum coccineum]